MRIPILLTIAVLIHGTLTASDGDAGPDQYLCSTFAVMQASPVDQGEVGTWSVVSGAGTFSDPNSPFAIVTGMAIGENEYRWTVVAGGVPQSDEVLITVFDPAFPGAQAGPDLTICDDTLAGNLQAVAVAYPVVGNWSVLSGDAMVAAPGQALSPVSFPGLGTAVLLWTVFNGPCGQTQDTVVVTVTDCETNVPEMAHSAGRLRYDPTTRSLIAEGGSGAELLLVDITGRTVLRRSLAGRLPQQIDLGGLPATIYLARMGTAAGTAHLRFSLVR